MLPLLLSVALGADCADTTAADVDRILTEILDANRNIDDEAFAASSKALDAALPCLAEVPPPSSVVRLHHTTALRAFVDGRDADARRSLAAVRAIDPGWTPPFPAGHPFTALWNDATDASGTEPIGSISPQAWMVDGAEARAFPVGRSFLLQVREADGTVVHTAYKLEPVDIPDYGQNDVDDPNEVPWMVSLRVLGTGRMVGQGQRVDGSAALAEQRASSFAPAGAVALRVVPDGRYGVEAHLSLLPDDDVIASTSAPMGVEGHLVGLVGTQGMVGARRGFVRGRAGVMSDTVRAWPSAGNGVQPGAWRIWGPSLGAEAGLVSERAQLDIALDGALAGLSPWRADLHGGGTFLLLDGLGLRAEGLGRLASQPLKDGEEPAGSVFERELRLSGGVDLVF